MFMIKKIALPKFFMSIVIAATLWLPSAAQTLREDALRLDTDSSISLKHNFPCRSLIVPGVMLAYGFTALKWDGFQDWNEEIHDEMWNESPHRQIHIDNYLQWVPAASVFALNFAGVKSKHSFIDRILICGIATAFQSSVVYSLKTIIHEARPNAEGTLSFPSGHTANAFAGAEFMRLEYKDVSPLLAIAGYAIAATTGYLRMYNNKHWLSDVVAGAGWGILSTDLAYYVYPYVKRFLFGRHSLSTVVMPTYQNGAWGIGMIHVFNKRT